MGMFDSLPRGSQVKCWFNMLVVLKVGDSVPTLYTDYVVLLREGGYVRVKDGTITKIVENLGRKYYYPKDFPNLPCIDKWGKAIQGDGDLEGIGLLNEHYYCKVT